MLKKFGQFKKLKCREGSQLCKLSQLCYHFRCVVKMKIIFFDIPCHPPPIAVQNSLTNQFFQKKIFNSVYLQQKKCKTEEKRRVPEKLVIFLLLKIYRNVNSFGNNDWSMNSGPQWAGVARDIKKNIIFILKTRQKMVTKLGQFTKLGPFSTFQLFKLSKFCYHFLSS